MSPFERFRGDFAGLADLMRVSWAENPNDSLEYSESFLQAMFEQPGSSFDHTVAKYEGDRLVAFGAAFPRVVRFEGQRLRLLLDSFITVAPSHKGRRLGGLVWNGLVQISQDASFDGIVTYCVEGDPMDRKLMQYSESFGRRTVHAMTVGYLARPVPPLRAGAAISHADPELLVRGSELLEKTSDFARVWDQKEAPWQCQKRPGAFGRSYKGGAREATIAGYTMQTSAQTPVLCGLIDDVLYEGLELTEQRELVSGLLESASALGVQVLLVPELHYADLTAFRAAGFRRTKRTLNMYVTSTSERLTPVPLERAYLDVF